MEPETSAEGSGERPARYPQAPAFSTQTKQPFQGRELTRPSESYQGQVLMVLRHGLQHISALIIWGDDGGNISHFEYDHHLFNDWHPLVPFRPHRPENLHGSESEE